MIGPMQRPAPQNPDAERAVIGAVLIRNEAFDAIAEILTVEDFYLEKHRMIWSAMEAMITAKRPIDAITLADALQPQFELIGGAGYIAECAMTGEPATLMAVQYARIVREKAIHRSLVSYGAALVDRAYDSPQQFLPEWTDDLVASAEFDLAQIASKAITKPEATKTETLKTVLWNLEHGIQTAIPSGYPTLDRIFGGFSIGHLTVLAARTSRGKTALATSMALNVSLRGAPVLYFTLEQPASELWERALGTVAMADTFAVRRRGLRDEEAKRLAQAYEDLEQRPLQILYRPSMRPRDLRLECKRAARDLGALKLVVIDYLGLMRGDRREKDRWLEARGIVLALKEIAGELGVPILLLSQLNRDADEKTPPVLANLRDTGAAEEHSSNVLFIWQKPAEKGAGPVFDDWEDIEVIIAKQRNGPAALRVPMKFKKAWGAFD